jgi:thiamine pyrophosphate-dependent acetolactate synthase large subunit-like protein
VVKAHGKQIKAAAKLLAEAKRPVFYVGGGVDPRRRISRAPRSWRRPSALPWSRR